jgi:hypothetical protein
MSTFYKIGNNFYNSAYVKSIECDRMDCVMTIRNTENNAHNNRDKLVKFNLNNFQQIKSASEFVFSQSDSGCGDAH